MRILFISDTLLTGDFAYRLKCEGNDVRLCILDPDLKECYDNLVDKVDDWKNELQWVGTDGLIIFDDIGFGDEQDRLRKAGYTVFGGSAGERIETDRTYAQKIFQEHGLRVIPAATFTTPREAIAHIQEHPSAWVIKYSNSHWLKPYAYIGKERDGSDVISVLENYDRYNIQKNERVTLQERVFGVEIGIARYFNGTKWVGPIEYNLEHTHLFPGNKGPIVNEMGTLAWYDENETEPLYQQTLAKLEPFLRASDFRGNFDIDCIVNENGAFPLEVTARFGAPIIHLQDALHTSAWGPFLMAIARGEECTIDHKEDFGVIISVVTPPFPYCDEDIGRSIIGTKIDVKDKKRLQQHKGVYFDEVASTDGTHSGLYIAGRYGYAYYATGTADSVSEARARSLTEIDNVYVPRMFYRDDIGKKFENEECAFLQKLGYLTDLTL